MPYKDHEQRLASKRRWYAMHRERERARRREYNKRPDVAMHNELLAAPLTERRISNLERRFGITLAPQFVEMLRTLREYRRFKNPWPIVSCACGCGSCFAERDEYGLRRRFVPGHNVKLPSHPRTPRGPNRQPSRQSLSPEARVERARKANAARWRPRTVVRVMSGRVGIHTYQHCAMVLLIAHVEPARWSALRNKG